MEIIQAGGRNAAQHNGVYRPGGRVCFNALPEEVLTGAGDGGEAGGHSLIIKPCHTDGRMCCDGHGGR